MTKEVNVFSLHVLFLDWNCSSAPLCVNDDKEDSLDRYNSFMELWVFTLCIQDDCAIIIYNIFKYFSRSNSHAPSLLL